MTGCRRRWSVAGGLLLVVGAALAGAGCSTAGQAESVAPPTTWTHRAVVGPAPVVDSTGQVWPVGSGFAGGQVTASPVPVTGAVTPDLFADSQVGVTSYRLPVPHTGTYSVVFLFADSQCRTAGCRIFQVSVDGATFAPHLDVTGLAGYAHALTLVTQTVVTGDTLTVEFTPETGSPIVSGIEVGFVGPGTSTSPFWQDNFNGPAGAAPNPRNWTFDTGRTGWGNRELQDYTDSRRNSRLDGSGNLQIVAQRDGTPEAPAYTSARLTTAHRFSFRYGVLQARVSVPVGAGLWPAVWLLGDNLEKAGWPRCGEMDLMEGNGGTPATVWAHVRGPTPTDRPYSIGNGTQLTGPTPPWHVYQLTWTRLGLGFAVDGQPYFSLTPLTLPAGDRWVFDQPFRILLNLAVGGGFVGSPNAGTPFPAVMSVDYVRVSR